MANNPKKVKDPTEVALSAIQEALNISDTTVDPNRNSLGNELAPQTSPSAPPPYSDMSFDTRGSAERPVFDPIEEPRSPRRAANDDRETIGQILQAIQKGSPARSVYTLATVFGRVWVLGAEQLFLHRHRLAPSGFGFRELAFLVEKQSQAREGRSHQGMLVAVQLSKHLEGLTEERLGFSQFDQRQARSARVTGRA